MGSSDEERSTSSSESRSSSVSRESRGECSAYDENDDDERGRTRSGRNYVAKETIIQHQIIEIRRLKENLENYREDDAVDHYGLPVVTKVDGSSSCYYFDGAKGRYAENRPPILVYGELSHFCSCCFAGNLDDCDSTSKDGYFVHEITMTREDGRGVAASRVAAQNERVARGKKTYRKCRST